MTIDRMVEKEATVMEMLDVWHENMGDVEEVLKGLPSQKKDKAAGYGRASLKAGREFAGATWTETLTMVREGWQVDRDVISTETREMMAEVEDRLNAHMENNFRDVRDVAGGYVDVAAYLEGDPECMVEQWVDEAPRKGKVLKVLSNVTCSAFIKEEVMRKRARAVATVVEVLHMLGFNLEVWAVGATRSGSHGRVCVDMVQVKSAEDPLDWDAVMFGIGHPAMLRRVMFGLWESREGEVRDEFRFHDSGGYGEAVEAPQEIRDQFDVYLPTLNSNSFDSAEFLRSVMVTLEDNRVSEMEV